MTSSGRANLLLEPENNRYVVHLLYGSPIQRGDAQVIEDLVPIYNTKVVLNVSEKIKSVRLVPENTTVKFSKTEDGISITVPEFTCHTAVVFEY